MTFLKRKNGLFKKAYELGVLCSVDVAVIIFEERPGHHVKLYQYCSGDVEGMVQRHLQFEGERDLKTPSDFSSTKADEGADDDEDAEDDDGGRAGKKDKPTQSSSMSRTAPSHSHGSGHGNVPIRPAQPTNSAQDLSRSIDMDFRAASGRHASSTSMNGMPILPVSNERHSNANASRPGSLNMAGMVNGNNGISMPLSLPVPPIGQQQLQHKRQRMDPSIAPPPGVSYPYRLDVDLSAFPPTTHVSSLNSQQSPQHHRPPSSSLGGLSFSQNAMGMNLGVQNDSYSSQTPFEFPSSRRSMSYASGHPGSGGSYGGNGSGSMNGMFGTRPGPQTTNMLMDLLNSTAANDVSSSFEWPGSAPATGQLDGTASSDATTWLEFLTSSNNVQSSPHANSLSLGLPTPITSRAASNSVSSTTSATSSRPPYNLPSAASSSECLSPSRKRSRDASCDFDDPGSGVLKAMKIGEGGRRSVG